MLDQLLAARDLPPLLRFADGRPVGASDFTDRRREMLDLLSREMYGRCPAAPPVVPENVVRTDELCGGTVTRRTLSLSLDCPGGRFSFPLRLYTPVGQPPAPVFVLIAFPEHIIQNDIPVSEILDRGYALAHFVHDDVSYDGGERRDGLWPLFPRDGGGEDWGTLSMWAFAASRVLDYLTTVPEVDVTRAAVIGHSRLGKTALLAGARDERFSLTISNDSGCGGAALSRGKAGEQIAQIIDRFPYWLAENYYRYSGHPERLPFDQHFLLASVAPRHLYVASAANDEWADPASEFLSAVAASPAWRLLGRSGLVAPDALPAPGDVFHEGDIGYHLRPGNHFLTRRDWKLYMDYRDRHGV